MFEASVDGKPYDNEKWGQYYRPYGIDAPAGSSSTSTAEATPAPAPTTKVAESTPAPVAKPAEATTPVETPAPAPQTETVEAPVAPATGGESKRAEDILAMIRSRQS